MGREIERKFLLADDAWREAVTGSRRMRQAYLAGTARASVRVRISNDAAWLNIKGGGLVAERDEFEYEIPVADAEAMLERLAATACIDKTRHYLDFEGMTWEIDEFHGDNDGLIVAELELDALDQAFSRPPWLGVEVTHLARYYNVSLVATPFRSWSEAERTP